MELCFIRALKCVSSNEKETYTIDRDRGSSYITCPQNKDLTSIFKIISMPIPHLLHLHCV